ncbi:MULTISPECIES: M60 family metallopeptidase [Bacillus cereus group]|uniref:M60 family metallopeptidase n=1 Tax=Bacillus cereus group TaxID=86661 RepID=UPI000BF3B999|nr:MULTISPECIES: M60 family metallopeptidase [Bacillus cereus group]PFI78320.1 S-layer protein [Bacillus cereus]
MKKHPKYKKQALAVIAACSVMTTSGLEVFAENTTQSSLSKPEISTKIQQNNQTNIIENRVFNVKGKGSMETLKQKERKGVRWSPYEPTGLYAKPNEEITIHVKGNQNIEAYIGTYSYVGDSGESESVEFFTLKPGTNTIKYPDGGMIYFLNEEENGTVQATIEKGGSPVPYFELGKHTKQDLIDMLNKYPDAYAVELQGERVLITATPTRVKEYLLSSNTDPTQLLKKMDEATRIQDKISGLSEEQVDKHYIHYVEDNRPGGYMYATQYRTAYVGDAIQYVLDLNKFTNDGWGPWHEAGHMRQQQPLNFHNMGEVQVNLYSLAVQKAFGHPTRLETSNVYPEAFKYLEQDAKNKDYDKIDDLFVKLVMLWQLNLAYGDEFYPTLHQQYRDMPDKELPTIDEDRKQVFMIEASKAAKQNLLPFFDQWGLKPNQNTIQKITQLGYPILVDPIWKSTDSKPVKPNNKGILEGNQFAWSMQGIGDWEFANINLNKLTKEMKIDLKAGTPHNYFDETYASIKVQKPSGQVVYNKEIYGDKKQNAETNKISVEIGDFVELTHKEGKGRATLINKENNKQENIGYKAIYKVTNTGLEKVEKMPEETVLTGNQFSWSLLGSYDEEFAKLDFNKQEGKMKIDLKAGRPHWKFEDEIYTSIKVQKPSGQVVYHKDIYGDKELGAETKDIQVQIGDFIELTHEEGDTRATLINKENTKQEKIGKKVIYKVTNTGLEKVEK